LEKLKKTTMRRIALYLLIVTAASAISKIDATAQTSFVPKNLGEQVNSPYSEINPVISIDGKTLFFTRVNHPENRFGENDSQDIWFTKLNDDGTWSPAQRASNELNMGRYNSILSALDDGKSYLILGRYNKKGTRWLARGISIVERKSEMEWGDPEPLKVTKFKRINRGRVVSAYLTPDKQLLLLAFSTSPNGKNLKMYVSLQKDEYGYSKPKSLKGGPRDARSAESPFLSKDKNRLYFSANFNDRSDNFDIYFSQRTDETYRNWSEPIRLTDTINSLNWDSYFKMNPKESWAYFSSINKSFGKSDIFRVKIFEEFPFVKVTGLVLNQSDQSLMVKDTTYRITVNGSVFPGFTINKYSASYEVLLPLGASYSILPEMENWNGISSTIDLTAVREYSEANVNLFFSAIPFVQVKGRVVDTRTNLPVPLERNPRVWVNGVPSDSVKFDKFSASFQALLPLGESYIFESKMDNFTGKPVLVDVKAEAAFQSRDITLLVTSVPWVELKGTALDNSSFTPILGDATPKLVINGLVADSVLVDPVSGNFSVRLPYGTNYNLAIKAKDYKPLDNKVDLTGYVEYIALSQNIFAEREDANMAILSGKIINLKTGKQLEEGFEVQLRVNGVETRAFNYDTKNASYTLKLPVGYNYDLTPKVMNFYNKFEPVDLTKTAPLSKIPRNFYVTPIEVGQSVDIENIYFETGKAVLKPESFRSLNALVQFLNEYPNVKVEIGGHTDDVGSASVNQKISEERALSVAEYVMAQGIPAHRIESKGYGFSKPKASNKTADGRAKNRRVDFTITGI
jgi:outer membrane protein OmpA-like peptidoglycan-associated protein